MTYDEAESLVDAYAVAIKAGHYAGDSSVSRARDALIAALTSRAALQALHALEEEFAAARNSWVVENNRLRAEVEDWHAAGQVMERQRDTLHSALDDALGRLVAKQASEIACLRKDQRPWPTAELRSTLERIIEDAATHDTGRECVTDSIGRWCNEHECAVETDGLCRCGQAARIIENARAALALLEKR